MCANNIYIYIYIYIYLFICLYACQTYLLVNYDDWSKNGHLIVYVFVHVYIYIYIHTNIETHGSCFHFLFSM